MNIKMERSNINRYNRQELIEGWDQKKLRDASITIVGADLLGQYILIPLLALGVGKLRILGNEKIRKGFFLDLKLKDNIAISLESLVNDINPDVDMIGLKSSILNKGSSYLLKGTDIVIDATNDPFSKTLTLDYCKLNNIPMISAGCDGSFGRIIASDYNNNDIRIVMPDFEGKSQEELVSMVLGGLIAEEVKKIVMQKEKLKVSLYYNLTNKNRFTFERSKDYKEFEGNFSDKGVLMIGAGALGNFVGLGLAKLGVGRIDILDDDEVEDTNLNRQILYYDCVGSKKSEALAEKLQKISDGNSKVNGYVKRFDDKTKLTEKYDIIFDCVDNFKTRAEISNYAVKNKIPLISGATDYQAGQVAVYIPKITPSIDYQLKLKDSAKKREEEAGQSCILAPNPSVIMTNQVIGGLMIGESRTIFDPDKFGEPIGGILKYGTNLENRLGINVILKEKKNA